jgi:tetratricopeptide (TPR) repeat protein
MENTTRDFELIQKYFGKDLTDAEKHEVEYRLKEDQAFKDLELEHRKYLTAIRRSHLQDKLVQLKTLEAALPSPGTEATVIPLRRNWIPMSIAAGLVAVVGFWYFSMRDTRPLNEKLFAANFEAFDSPGSGLTRGGDSKVSIKDQAYEAYDAGQYEIAANLFEQVLGEKDDAIVHLCLSNAYLATGKTDQAEKVLQHVLHDHVDLVTQAKWYLALTYLKQGNLERTRSVLWEISKSSTYGNKAKQLLNALE